MSYCIIWETSSGIAVTIPFGNPSIEEISNQKDKLIAEGYAATFLGITTTGQLPTDRYFRPAWRWNGSSITLDLAACKQRHLDKLRRIRNTKLQESDADYMRALEQEDQVKLTTLKVYRQALRDMPQTSTTEFQAAATPEAVRSIQPTILNTAKP